MFDNTPNQLTKNRTKKWAEVNDRSYGVYNTGSQIKFKTSMLKLSLRDYSDAYILVKGTVTIPNTRTVAAPNNKIKKVLFRNCAPFTGCISKA